MGLRGPNARPLNRPAPGMPASSHPWSDPKLSRAERLTAFIETLPLTAGKWAGQRFRLRPWQKRELRKIYRTDASGQRVVRTVCWSTARANGKTGLAAVIALAHLVGPESQPRGEIYAAANDKFQA